MSGSGVTGREKFWLKQSFLLTAGQDSREESYRQRIGGDDWVKVESRAAGANNLDAGGTAI